jgi:hypothetical protein
MNTEMSTLSVARSKGCSNPLQLLFSYYLVETTFLHIQIHEPA